jgi:arabinoxylan arabinofuranohydrolase
MLHSKIFATLAGICCLLLPWVVNADNCFILEHPTSDPAPSVFTDPRDGVQKVFFYCTQDKVGATGTYPIDTIGCYSSTDMYHWKNEGVALDEKSVTWAKTNAHQLWAPHIYYLKGVYQLIVPETSTDGYFYNFTAHSATPQGPYTPAAVGHLPKGPRNVIDPFCFIDTMGAIDSNGQYTRIDSIRVWLSYRHQNGYDLGLVRMNDSGTAVTGDTSRSATIVTTGAGTGYKEGSWMWKRHGVYFLVFAFNVNNSGNEIIAYSTAHNVTGPWTYKGQLFAKNSGEYTIHSGACDFKGQHYINWHNITWGGSIFGGERCSGWEYIYYSNDSTIDVSRLNRTNRGVGVPSAYTDSIHIDRGTTSNVSTTAIAYNTTSTESKGWYLSSINNNGYVKYDSVDFTPSSSAYKVTKMYARIGCTVTTDTIIACIDSLNGPEVGRVISKNTQSLTTWQTDSSSSTAVSVTGHHNLFVKFKMPSGSANLNVNWIKFQQGAVTAIAAAPSANIISTSYSYARTNKNTFTIVSPCAVANASVRMFNVRGQEVGAVSTKALSNNRMQVNLNAGTMTSGAYILSVKNAGGNQYKIPFVY